MATCTECVHVEVCYDYLSESYKGAHMIFHDLDIVRNIKSDNCENYLEDFENG